MANSFVPTTPVLMADGTTKAIADIRVGDRVEAADPETGGQGGRRVVATVTGEGYKHLVDVSVGGATVTATAGHPFWLADERRWVDAAALRAGDVLLLSDGGHIRVGAVAGRAEHQRVHNLTVEGLHTYFVVVAGHAILTHNCSRPKDGGLAGAPQATRSLNLPFRDAGLRSQVDDVVTHFDEFGRPPTGVAQGGLKGHPKGTYGGQGLPDRPLGYYTESDVWVSGGGIKRGAERLVFGRGGEVYYTPTHYDDFVRIR